jgi:hypothetical protein
LTITGASAWTAWKYAMWDAGLKLPTQSPDQHARCLCGAPIDIAGMAPHVYAAHMSKRQTEVESWQQIQSYNIEFTMKRLREPIERLCRPGITLDMPRIG